MCIKKKGFTIMETMVVILIIGLLISFAIPNVFDYRRRINGTACANSMRSIQMAKDAWIRDYPSTPTIPSTTALMSYLKTPIPQCPAGGTYYSLLDCTQPVSCSLNNNPNFEPANSLNPDQNGYHDLSTVE